MKKRTISIIIIFCITVAAILFSSFIMPQIQVSELINENAVDYTNMKFGRLAKAGTIFSYRDKISKTEPSSIALTEKLPVYGMIEDFDIILQMPELPTGCEITAMTMVLRHYGFNVDKTVMAEEYLPTAPASFTYENGRMYGPDTERYFVGDPATNGGYICGPTAIVTAANAYLDSQGSSLDAVDISGSEPSKLYRIVNSGTPVVVWVTIYMAERNISGGWYTQNDTYVDWAVNDHGAVLIGYDGESVTIADPISGLVTYSRDAFESVFASRGNKCVILR